MVSTSLPLRAFPFNSEQVTAVITTRHGGVSQGVYRSLNLGGHVGDDPEAVAENRRRLASALGVRSLTIADHATVATTGMEIGANHDAGITDTLDINSGTLAVGSYLTNGDAGTARRDGELRVLRRRQRARVLCTQRKNAVDHGRTVSILGGRARTG